MRDLYLAIDVGTGGLRSALVDRHGKILAYSHKEHEQIVRKFGWSEQRPDDWWMGTVQTIYDVLQKVDGAAGRIAAICCCGQMHGTVLIDDNGALTRDTAPLWNDKRTLPQVAAMNRVRTDREYLDLTANLPAPAWPAGKLAWIAQNDPNAFGKSATVLMPKDWINFKLTGKRAQDVTEASLSFLMDRRTRKWSPELCDCAGVPTALLPELLEPGEILGKLSSSAADELGLDRSIPVLVGAGDFPMALTGSGLVEAGMGSDVTGTSTIISLMHKDPVLDPEVSNVISASGLWAAFTLLDAGGDAVRWARRAFHENKRSYAEVAQKSAEADPGVNKLFFLPYLSGERFGANSNARAQFFGLTASHGLADLHRAVLEGVAFSVRQKLDALQGDHGRPDRIVAASGGAKNTLWLEIKASMYNTPYLIPDELECGIVGAAMLMAQATGDVTSCEEAAAKMVSYSSEIQPNPKWAERYDRMMPIYARLYESSKAFYDDLDAL
ncbi:FGGY family carbohydrate kinase [Ruegeria sp. SCPT10]|uniref:xylulokinase n=1 Tax=Ruegeria sp. SCP10 TaxID=3141377 RepID=UPI003334E553